MLETLTSEREFDMKGRFPGVVKIVTVAPWWRRRRERWRRGMVWPLAMKGKRMI